MFKMHILGLFYCPFRPQVTIKLGKVNSFTYRLHAANKLTFSLINL